MGCRPCRTGPAGWPLRAVTSVSDPMDGLFGAIGALAALHQRDRMHTGTGQGREVQSALFENILFLVAQHMMQFAVTGRPAARHRPAHPGAAAQPGLAPRRNRCAARGRSHRREPDRRGAGYHRHRPAGGPDTNRLTDRPNRRPITRPPAWPPVKRLLACQPMALASAWVKIR